MMREFLEKIRNQFGNCELRDENKRTYGSAEGHRDLFERLTNFLAGKGVPA